MQRNETYKNIPLKKRYLVFGTSDLNAIIDEQVWRSGGKEMEVRLCIFRGLVYLIPNQLGIR